MWSRFGKTFATAIALATTWALLEASWLLFSTQSHRVAVRPVSGLSLFAAALFNYGLLGVVGGLVAGLVRVVVERVRPGRPISEVPFVLASLGGLGAVVVLGLELRRGPLQGVERGHPLLVGAIVGLAALAVPLGVGAYLLLRLAGRGLARLLGEERTTARAIAMLLAVAGLMTLGGAGKAVLRSAGVLDLHRPTGLRFARPARPAPPTPRPNVILVTYETTRADHVNALGYQRRVTTPYLDRLAERGALFRESWSQAPWTVPSMASLFTSLYPGQHGIVETGRVLDDSALTLPDTLAAAGYVTASFFGNNFANQPGFGFDEAYGKVPLLDPFRISPVFSGPLLIKGLQRDLLTLLLRVTFPRDERWYYDAERMNGAVLSWLEHGPQEPFFLHVHYIDPHDPYFAHPKRWIQFDPRWPSRRDLLVERYDQEIAFVDGKMGQLVETLEADGYLDDAILVVTSDHGEEFLDRGGWGHRHHVYSELLRVPLVVVAPGRLPEGVEVSAPAQTIDVAPTILDLAGIAPPPEFAGRSLVPAIQGRDATAPGGEPAAERAVLAQLTTTVGNVDTLVVGHWKLVRSSDTATPAELYDLAVDPGEKHNAAAQHAGVLREMESRLEAMLAEIGKTALSAGEKELSEDELDQLRALGYVD